MSKQILLATLAIALIFGMTACDDGGGGSGGGGGKGWTAITNHPFGTKVDIGGSGSIGVGLINTIVYGNGKFVAGGSGDGLKGVIATSTDGITWTAQTNHPFDSSVSLIVFGNGKFVAVGSGGNNYGKMAYSSDGITWTAVADTKIPYRYIHVAYGNGKFIAYGENIDLISYSSDGATWTALTDHPFQQTHAGVDGIAYYNNKFYAWGFNFSESYDLFLTTSTDGITWTDLIPTSLSREPISITKKIAYSNGKFVLGYYIYGYNYGNLILTSSDGLEWTPVFKTSVNAIAYGNGKFVAGGSDGQMAVSRDGGVTWTADTGWADVTTDLAGPNSIWAIAYGNGKFVAGGGRSQMAYWDGK
jgi:hypothetical protein